MRRTVSSRGAPAPALPPPVWRLLVSDMMLRALCAKPAATGNAARRQGSAALAPLQPDFAAIGYRAGRVRGWQRWQGLANVCRERFASGQPIMTDSQLQRLNMVESQVR